MGSNTRKLQRQIDDLIKQLKAEGIKTAALERRVDAIKDKPDADDELRKAYEDWKVKTGQVPPPPPPPPPGPVQKPTEGKEQPEKGGNQDPSTWKIVNMTKDPALFKVVDNKGINIVVEFTTKAIAQQYIDWAKQGTTTPPPPPPPPPPTGGGDKDQFGITRIYSDEPNGIVKTNFTLDKKVRNYASGKPSEPSVEYTCDTGTPVLNSENTYYVKINGFKPQSDTISNKVRGGHHSSSNPTEGTCYDFEISTDGSTDKDLEVERPHPQMHDAHQPTKFTIGESIVGKWIGIKAIAYNLPNYKGVHLEMHLDYPVADITKPPNNWRLYWVVDDTGQIDSGMITVPFGSLFTSRIDGVWNGPVNDNPTVDDVSAPDYAYASVREISPTVVTPPPPPDHTCATGEHWDDAQGKCVPDVVTPPPPGDGGADVFGVKKIYPDDPAKITENWSMTDLTHDSRVSISGTVKDLGNGVFEGHVTTADNPASFRINVRTTNPRAFDINTQQINGFDWAKKKQLGYMIDAKDWRNCEATIYWKATQWDADDEMSIYWRGGHHSDGWKVACLATDMKGQIQRAGNSRFAKEHHHFAGSDGYVFQKGNPKFTLSARENVWTGQKFVQFDDGQKITLQVWADESGSEDPAKQNWKLMNEMVDDGHFGEPKNTDYIQQCNATPQQVFLWGGPGAVFRIDNVIVQVKKASVRHISATAPATVTTVSGAPDKLEAVIANPDQTVGQGQKVTLDGSTSKGDISSYQWEDVAPDQPHKVTIDANDKAKASFVAPKLAQGETVTIPIRLTIKDKGDTTSSTAVTNITVS